MTSVEERVVPASGRTRPDLRGERIEAEMLAKDPNYRGLGYWIEQVKAERDAENAA